MFKNKYLFLLVILIAGITNSRAQDAHFSQFYSAPLVLSPSLTGSTGKSRVVINSRVQSPEENRSQTHAISADVYLPKYRSGLGLSLLTDIQGPSYLTNNSANLHYSYRIKLHQKWHVIPAMKFTFGNISVNTDDLLFVDEIESGGNSAALMYFDDSKHNYYDFASSLFFYSENLWFGISADHLLKPDYSFTQDQVPNSIKITNFGGINVWTKKSYKDIDARSASITYRFEYQNNFKQLDLGVYWHESILDLGFWYRGVPVFKNDNVENHYVDNDALIFMTGISKESFRIGYSYDFPLSNAARYNEGAHELSFMFVFGKDRINGKGYSESFSKHKGLINPWLRYNKRQPRKMDIF